jgi:putative restriction endonuclease
VHTAAGGNIPGSNLGDLRSSGATGELEPKFARALVADPLLLVRIARMLLDTNFPVSLHEDIASLVGLDLSDLEVAPVVDMTARRRRSPQFRDQVLMAYELSCAMCGWDGALGAEPVGLEAAHIRWFNIDGPDTLDNGICLCSLHHKLLDTGAIGITTEHTISVSTRFVGRGPVAEQLVLGLVDKELAHRQPGLPAIASVYIEWHNAQVFRSPRRRAA